MKKWHGKWRVFLAFALLFGGVGDRQGNLSPSALAKNKWNAVFA